MNKDIYKIELQQNLILLKKAKTEQTTESLDYIPGAIFRGIIAGSLFAKGSDKINEIIFDGSVQFGDAHIVINDHRSYKIPASFYNIKGESPNSFDNFHFLEEKDWKKKLKQYRKDYFIESTEGIQLGKLKYGDSIKSSRNRETRSSKEGGMFVYHYLRKGQVFEFEIRSKEEGYLNEIKTILNEKTKYIAKSKGAEFGGKAKINHSKRVNDTSVNVSTNYLYAESNLCFLNEYGEFTASPSGKQLTGNDAAKIDWKKSQIRFRTYSPYNVHRNNWDSERLIIEKGSVFVLKEKVDISVDILENGVGCFKTEGYGRILANPSFLANKTIAIQPTIKNGHDSSSSSSSEGPIYQDDLLIFLKAKSDEQKFNEKIQKSVDKYIEDRTFSKHITSSQWSRVYNGLKMLSETVSLDYLLFDEDKGICKGGLKNVWRKTGADVKMDDFLGAYPDERTKVKALKILSKKMRFEKINEKTINYETISI